MSQPALRPRSAAEIVDAAVQLTRGVYIRLVVIGALFYIPSVLVRLIGLRGAEVPADFGARDWFLLVYDQAWSGLGWAAMLVLLAQQLLSGGADLRDALRRVHGDAWRLTLVGTATGTAATIGLFLLIVPGVILNVLFFAVPQTLLFETQTMGASIKRSVWLSGQDVKRLTWATVLTLAISVALWAGSRAALRLAMPDGWVLDSAAGAVSLLIEPVFAAAWLLLYFDVRMRTEGWDLDRDIRRLGDRGLE